MLVNLCGGIGRSMQEVVEGGVEPEEKPAEESIGEDESERNTAKTIEGGQRKCSGTSGGMGNQGIQGQGDEHEVVPNEKRLKDQHEKGKQAKPREKELRKRHQSQKLSDRVHKHNVDEPEWPQIHGEGG